MEKSQDIIQTVQRLECRLKDHGHNVSALNEILLNKTMQALLKVHETVKPSNDNKDTGTSKSNGNAMKLLNEVYTLVGSYASNNTTVPNELYEFLNLFQSSPHLTALLRCHDQIASKSFEPELPEQDFSNISGEEEEESMKVVRLVKGDEPLGATIALDEVNDNIVIARILKGGAADRSGLIHVNDILVEVNKIPAVGKKPEELINVLANYRGALTFRLIPGEAPAQLQDESSVFIRAKIDYDPEQDPLIPCAEAGLCFRKNDVLKIVSRDDEMWWQAAVAEQGIHQRLLKSSEHTHYHTEALYKTTSTATRAGLIPSARLQNRRQALKRQSSIQNVNNNVMKGSNNSLTNQKQKKNAWTLLRQSFRRSNRHLDTATHSPELKRKLGEVAHTDPAALVAYEEVELMAAPSESSKEDCHYRPFVLVGPQGVGRNLLKDRLIDSNPTRYGVPVPHTSRQKLEDEEDGRDYHFVSREFLERGIKDQMFLEYGEYKGNLYGTSIEAVKTVIANHQVCVLTPYPQALRVLQNAELKPFVVFIKPPSLDNFLHSSDHPGVATKLTIDRNMNMPFSEDELRDLVSKGLKMESAFGHLFDCVVVNDGIDNAFAEIKHIAFAVENEPQWVPKAWMKNEIV